MELKYISEEERNNIPSADFAGPNHSFPINSQAHVLAAAHLYGRAEDPEKIKANIIKIARRKGYALPPEWQEDGGLPEVSGMSASAIVRRNSLADRVRNFYPNTYQRQPLNRQY